MLEASLSVDKTFRGAIVGSWDTRQEAAGFPSFDRENVSRVAKNIALR